MTTASIIALLQAALMLLTLAQSNPSLPQSVRDNAVQVAQQALAEATKNLSSMVSPPTETNPVPEVLSISVVETETRNNIVNYRLNVPARYAGHTIVFILNPKSVYPPIGSGSLIVTQTNPDWKGGQLTGSVSVQNAHEGFATNQGGVHWFATSPGSYVLTVVVYPQSPFKPGTEMEYWSVEEQRARGISAAEVVSSNVFRIVPQFSETASLSATPRSGSAPLSVYFRGSGSILHSSAGIDFGDGSVSGEGVISTTHVYQNPGTYTARLLKDGAKGEEVARTIVTVHMAGAAPVINWFSGPQLIKPGESAVLNWSATNNNMNDGGCYIFANGSSGTAVNYSNGNAGFSGSQSVSPSVKTTYMLKCYSSWKDGSPTAEKTVTVDVLSPSQSAVDIKAAGADSWDSMASIGAGTAVLLTWTSSNVGVCDVESSSGGVVGNTPAGSKSVTLSQTTTFTIECLGSYGQVVSDSVTVVVESAPTSLPIIFSSPLAGSYTLGSTMQVRWSASAAAGLELENVSTGQRTFWRDALWANETHTLTIPGGLAAGQYRLVGYSYSESGRGGDVGVSNVFTLSPATGQTFWVRPNDAAAICQHFANVSRYSVLETRDARCEGSRCVSPKFVWLVGSTVIEEDRPSYLPEDGVLQKVVCIPEFEEAQADSAYVAAAAVVYQELVNALQKLKTILTQ